MELFLHKEQALKETVFLVLAAEAGNSWFLLQKLESDTVWTCGPWALSDPESRWGVPFHTQCGNHSLGTPVDWCD